MDNFMFNLHVNAPKTMSRHMFISFIGTLFTGALYFYMSLITRTSVVIPTLVQMFIFIVFLFVVDFYNGAYIYKKYEHDDEIDTDDLILSLRTFAIFFVIMLIATITLCSFYTAKGFLNFIPKEIFALIPSLIFMYSIRFQYIRQAKKIVGY